MHIEQPRYHRSLDLLWLSLTLVVVLLVAFILPVVPNDYWWYVRLGQDMLRGGAIPAVDTFSYTRAGTPVVYHSWLSALIFWLVYQAGGLPLTFLVRGIFLGVAYGLTWRVAREAGAGPKLAGLLTVVSALLGSNNWSFRPQMFAYVLFVLALWVLLRWQRGGHPRLWLLPLAAVLWVNLHGSFVLLFILLGTALLFGSGNRKRLLIWTVVSLLATLLNPRLLGAWAYVLSLLYDPASQSYSGEWGPPQNAGWQMNLFFGWILTMPLLVAISTRRLSRLEWAWFLLFGWMALSGLRYVVWTSFLLVPLTAALLSDRAQHWLDRPPAFVRPAINNVLSISILLATLLALPGVREYWWKGPAIPLQRATPVEAASWLKTHPELPGPLWADMTFSSYLVFAVPERPVWIDTRFEVYPPAHWQEYIDIGNAVPAWQSLLEREHVNLLFLARGGQPNLIAAVEVSPEWCRQYQDEMAVIFARCVKK
jgi:hypothetical protein